MQYYVASNNSLISNAKTYLEVISRITFPIIWL